MTEVAKAEQNIKKIELEEMKADIQAELVKIRNIQKTLDKLTKLDKGNIISAKTKVESELPKSKRFEKSAIYKTPFTLDEELDLFSYSKRNTIDGTSASVINKGFLNYLGLSKSSSLNDLIISLNDIIEDEQIIPNPVYKILSRNNNISYISKLSENSGLSTTHKEKLSEMLLLYSIIFNKKPTTHLSIEKVMNYLDTENLVCGLNFAKSVQGFDQMIIKVENCNGFRKLKNINLIELKYRYKNHLSWLVPSQAHNPKIFEQSVRQILKNTQEIGAYFSDSSGNINLNTKSSFGRYLSETRGNGAIIKMDQWHLQIAAISSIWKHLPSNSGKIFPLDEVIPHSKGKTLQDCLYEVLIEQFRLEALAESEFIINYTGKLLGKHSILPLCEKKFKFTTDDKIHEQLIKGSDFRIYDKSVSNKKFKIYHPSFRKGLDVSESLSFPLIDNKELLEFLKFDSRKYRIYISNEVSEIISSDNRFIICSQGYYDNYKQYLCGEIKTRFLNDIRDNLKISGWRVIVSQDFKLEHDLVFITSNPIPRDYFNRHSGEYRFHNNLHKLKAEHHILGIDNVSCFALKPDIDTRENINSDWFQNLDNRFHRGEKPSVHIEVNTNLIDPFLDLSKTYGHNIPNPEWENYGKLTVNTFISSGKYGIEPENIDSLETDSFDMMENLPKPYTRSIVFQKYDVYSESKKLFSRDSKFTLSDISQSSSNNSKRKIVNEIRAEYLNRQSFDGIPNETKMLITLISKCDNTKKLVRNGKDIFFMDQSIEVHRDQINYFPLVRKYENKSTNSQRYTFEIHSSSPYILNSIRNNLLDCLWISDEGRLKIEKRYENWIQRLATINSKSQKAKKTIYISLNAFETIWLLLVTLKNMKELEKELFTRFHIHYEFLKARNSLKEVSGIWPVKYGELNLRNFRKNYSFGLMGSSLRRYNHRIIYEVMSTEFRNFVDVVYMKCMQLLMYSGSKPYLRWTQYLIEEMGNILYLD